MKSKEFLAQVVAADYTAPSDDGHHNPACTIENLKRHDKIMAKIRKAGVTDEELDFLLDFHQADAVHVMKLCAARESFEVKKAAAN